MTRKYRLAAVVLGSLALFQAGSFNCRAQPDFRKIKWQIDPRCVLARGESFDRRVVGDPCIVWDDTIKRWRMFYFASGTEGSCSATALSESAEQIGPGDWKKIGLVQFTNPDALINPSNWHKWWLVMDARQPNHAVRIEGLYWALFVSNKGNKHIQVASSQTLEGPWMVRPAPILSPDPEGRDGLHCDTPSAFWFEEKKQVLIYYKAYPKLAQKDQPGSPFGSSTVAAWWHPSLPTADKGRPVMRPGRNDDDWNRGWTSGVQLFYAADARDWYALTTGSPTPPQDKSHREPPPSLGGWADVRGLETDLVLEKGGPFRDPEDLSREELEAGLAVNFWRHHLLATPGGQVRIFFNSGAYGKEQMYSLVPVPGTKNQGSETRQ